MPPPTSRAQIWLCAGFRAPPSLDPPVPHSCARDSARLAGDALLQEKQVQPLGLRFRAGKELEYVVLAIAHQLLDLCRRARVDAEPAVCPRPDLDTCSQN